jgi:exonuclease III
VTVIQCYAPTNDADPEQKDIFYETLQAEVGNTPSQDLLIVMGDLNAMVGAGNMGNQRVMGRHGYGHLSDNAEMLLDLCGMNNLLIGGTLFQHKDIHKISCNSPQQS